MSNFSLLSRRARILSLLVLIAAMLITGKTFAADASQEETSRATSRRRKSLHPHCGLYCVYTVLELSNQKVDFRELVTPEYISSSKGSSVLELIKAAEDHGLYAVPAGKLSSRELQSSPYPIILHIKSSLKTQEYNHYELFLGTENDKAKLFNPPEPVRLVPYSEIAPRWAGNGLIISTEPIDLDLVFGPGRKRLLVYVAAAIAAILGLHFAKRWLPEAMLNSRSKLFGLSIGQGAVFAIVAFLCGTIYHFANGEGLLANANATASIQQAHQGNFIPKISERKVRKLLDSDTIFIDARLARDYKAGHLDGAISVPVDANDVERRIITADISKDARAILYCQSSACKYAEKVAIKLIDDGFSNISIFKGGWAEWVEKNGKNKKDETS